MTVEKFIRILGYIVYVALWSPVLVVLIPALAIWSLVMYKRMGFTVREALGIYLYHMEMSIQHDINFIKTGVWM